MKSIMQKMTRFLPDIQSNHHNFPLLIFLFTFLQLASTDLDDFKTPCHVRKSSDQNFNAICAIDYLQKPYICDVDHGLSRTEIDRIDRDVIKPAKFFYYCPCSGQKCKNAQLISGDQPSDQEESGSGRSRRSKWKQQQQSGYGGKQSAGQNLIGMGKKSIILSINVYKKLVYPKTRFLLNNILPCAASVLPFDTTPDSDPEATSFPSDPYLHPVEEPLIDHQISQDQILDIYSALNEDRWRSPRCHPNLTISVFTDQTITYDSFSQIVERQPPEAGPWRPRIHARINRVSDNPTNNALISKTDELIRLINQDNTSATGALKLERFLSRLAEWYQSYDGEDQSEQMTHRLRHHHTIPRWAAITFAVCSVLSVLAVLVGNFVTSSKVTRRSKNNNGNKSKRKWGAGFSGGMWASV